MIDLNDFKNKKKLAIVQNDLIEANKRLATSIELLKEYSKYIPIMESLSVLHNSRTILEIHLDKYKRILNNEKIKLE